jgi:hypothetical protein
MLSIVIVLSMLAALFGMPTSVSAVAYGTAFISSITYMNIGAAATKVDFLFYAENSTSTTAWSDTTDLPVNGATSLWAGTVFTGTTTFNGSVVISSGEPLGVTSVMSAATVKNRLISNGFTVGAPSYTIPTVLRATYNANTIFAVQNADSEANDVTVSFNPTTGAPIVVTVLALPAGATKIYDMGSAAMSPVVGATFNGSVGITAKKTAAPASDGAIVASAQELSTNSDGSYAFEGVAGGSAKIYMPSAMCNQGANGDVNSAYAIMNVGTVPVDVTVAYAAPGHTQAAVTIQPGKKGPAALGCGTAPNANPSPYLGSAVITAVVTPGNTGTPLITAIGKIGGSGMSTAYTGFTAGAQKFALPYVRWTVAQWLADGTRQRVNIAVQNVSATDTIAIGQLSVTFYNYAGVQQGSPITNASAIGPGAKWNTNAAALLPAGTGNEFGYVTKTGGGAIVQGPAGSQLAVIARASTYLTATTSTGEDYSGIPLP